MALPKNGTEWPPRPYDKVFDQIDEWQMWWEGTALRLQNFYRPFSNGVPNKSFGERAGAAWNELTGKNKKAQRSERRLHMPVAGDLFRMSRSLMFANGVRAVIDRQTEPVPNDDGIEIERPVEDTGLDEAQSDLDRLVNNDRVQAQLLSAAESAAALGGVYLRVVWDTDVVPDAPWLEHVDADHAIPEFLSGKLVAITFWSDLGGEKDVVYRHLQRYTRGSIQHALYKGTAVNLGEITPLTEHDRTAILCGTINEATGETENVLINAYGMQETGTDGLCAVYIPNQLPNPAWRHNDQLRHVGMSDISNDVIPVLVAIDEVWTSLMRDVGQGKGRVIVSENLLEVLGPGQGTAFDMDREYFSPVAEAIDADGKPIIEQVQFEIREGAHLTIIEALVREVLRRTGYSPMSFGLTEGVQAVTATEVRSHIADTETTVQYRRRLWGPELADIYADMLKVNSTWFGSEGGLAVSEDLEAEEPVTVIEPTPSYRGRDDELKVIIEWPEIVAVSMEEKARTLSLLEQAGAMSLREKVAYLHDEWDDKQIDAEVALITKDKEAAMPVVEPPFGGGESGGDEEDPESDADASKGPPTGNDTSEE